MTTTSDIIHRGRADALRAALAVMGASMTDRQLDLVASELAGKSPAEIKMVFSAVLPPQEQRTGILLPYCVDGHMSEYATRCHDLTVLVLGLASSGGADIREFSAFNKSGMRAKENEQAVLGAPAAIKTRAAPVGSRIFYQGWTGAGPQLFRKAGDTISAMAVWQAVGLTPAQLSVGYSGTAETKGQVTSEMGGSPFTSVAARSTARGTADDDFARASVDASALDEVE